MDVDTGFQDLSNACLLLFRLLSPSLPMLCPSVLRRNEAPHPLSYEILSSCPPQPLPDQVIVPAIPVLQDGSLNPLLLPFGTCTGRRVKGSRPV